MKRENERFSIECMRCRHDLKAPTNEEAMLRKQIFPRLRPQETVVEEGKFASWEAKMFLRNMLLPQQMFPRLRAEETFRETMFPQQWFLVCGRLY